MLIGSIFGGRGLHARRACNKHLLARACVQALEPRMLLSTSLWTPVGPAGLSSGSSGPVAAVAADPVNSNVLYVAAAGGGVWKTVDVGTSWTPLTDNQNTLSMGALAVSRSNPSVIYAGTGEAMNSPASLNSYGRGVLKSSDGGNTWTLQGNSVFNRMTISQIAIDPTNPNNVYAAVGGAGVNGLAGTTGIYHSTDGGNTWTNTTAAVSTTAAYTDVEIDPASAQHLLCAVGGGVAASGIYVTTNGGTSWSLVTANGLPSGTTVGWTKLAFAPSNSQVVYASFASNSSGSLLSMWSSSTSGSSWSQLANVPNYMGTTGSYDSTLIVDPRNPAIVYAGGAVGGNSFIESTNSGASWTDISTGSNGVSPQGSHHALAFDADGRLIDGNDGGIWRLDNPTPIFQAWTNLTSNLQIAEFLSGSLNPTNPSSAYAGSQGNGTDQFTGGANWTATDSGDNGAVRISPTTVTTIYHQSPLAVFGGAGIVRKSTNSGSTWSNDTTGITTSDPQNYFAPLVIDPANGNHLFFGTNRIYETTNGGTGWAPISTTSTNGWTTTGNVAAIAMAPSAPTTIYASAGGHLFVTTADTGSTTTVWTQHDPPNPATFLLVDPTTSTTCYAVTSTFGVPHVYKTNNSGTTWTSISGTLPDLPTYTIAINGSALYVGNDNGVYASTDGGTTWNPYGSGLPNVQVRDLEFNPMTNTLAAFTLGRGAFEISTALPNPLVVNTTQDETTGSDGLTSLREAVILANSSGGTITFDSTVFATPQDITLNSAMGNISISTGVTINGPAARSLTISAGGGAALEVASGASVSMSNLLLSGSGTVLQVDSSGQASLGDVTVGGNVSDNGAITFEQAINDSVTGQIVGGGSIAKTGTSSLTLGVANIYGGGTTVSAGTLQGSTISLSGNIAVSSGATLIFDQSTLAGTSGSFAGSVSGAGTVRLLGPSSTVILGASATLTNSGATVIDAGATLTASAANDIGGNSALIVNGSLNLGGFNQTGASLAGAATGAVYNISTQSNLTATLTLGGNTPSTVFDGVLENVPSGSVNGGRLAITQNSTGTLQFNRPAGTPNTFTGGTRISAGVLVGNTASIVGSIVDNSLLTFDQTIAAVSSGTYTGSITGGGGISFLNGTVTLGSGALLRNFGNTTINGKLVCPATGSPNALGSISSYTVNGTLDLGGASQTVGSLNGTGTVYHFQPVGQPAIATLTLGGDGSSTTFTGVLLDTAPASGNGGLLAVTKVGTGLLTLTGANTFSGGLIVSGGTLAVGPVPSAYDPMGAGTVTLNGGNLALNGKLGTPVQQLIPATGYNQDLIVEAVAANAQVATTSTFDSTYVWYEKGFAGSAGTGLPATGTIFASAINPAVNFQLQPYSSNNVALIPGNSGSVTMNLAAPTPFSMLNFLAASANGNASLSVTLTFSDSTQTFTQLAVSDWFNGSNTAISAGGRIVRSTSSTVTLTGSNPRLYEYDYAIPVIDQAKPLVSITFNELSGSDVGIYALSGTASTIQASQSYPNALQVLNSASIDVENPSTASLGNLTMSATVLSLTGPSGTSLAFGPVTMTVSSHFNTSAGTALTLGSITAGPTNNLTKIGTGTLTLSGTDTYGATTDTAGTLIAATGTSLPGGSLTIGATGTTQLQRNATAFSASLSSLSIATGGKLDISNNTLFINYGASANDPMSLILGYLKSGYNNGAWIGTSANGSILSSSAAANVNQTTAIGYVDSADGSGINTTPNSIELKYTLYGDTGLTGTVGFTDFMRMTQHFTQTTGTSWSRGDFNYDGTVDVNDFNLLKPNYGQSLPAAVPTPTVAGPNDMPLSAATIVVAPNSAKRLRKSVKHRGRSG